MLPGLKADVVSTGLWWSEYTVLCLLQPDWEVLGDSTESADSSQCMMVPAIIVCHGEVTTHVVSLVLPETTERFAMLIAQCYCGAWLPVLYTPVCDSQGQEMLMPASDAMHGTLGAGNAMSWDEFQTSYLPDCISDFYALQGWSLNVDLDQEQTSMLHAFGQDVFKRINGALLNAD